MGSAKSALVCVILLVTSGTAAVAQNDPAQASSPPPVGADPSATSASYGDWVVRCAKPAEGGASRLCEAVQTLQVKNQQAPIAQIAFGKASDAEPLKLVIVLPINVSFPSAVTFGPSEKGRQDLDLPWRRCQPGGCFAEAAVPSPALQRWRKEAGRGRLAFKDAAGRDVALPTSFRGLAQALDALAKP